MNQQGFEEWKDSMIGRLYDGLRGPVGMPGIRGVDENGEGAETEEEHMERWRETEEHNERYYQWERANRASPNE